MAQEEYTPDIVMVRDEDGSEYMFEALDRIETDDGRFVALAPLSDNGEDMPEEEEGEFIVLEMREEDGETYLAPVEDEALLDEIGNLFEERLAILFGDEEEDQN